MSKGDLSCPSGTVYYQGLSNRDKKFLDQAMTIASVSSCRQKHGAILVRGGRVLSVGVNSMRNHPSVVTNPKTDASVHAEVAAIRAAADSVGATLYIARVNKQGEPRMSMPCEACMKAIVGAGIKLFIYTT